MKFTCRTCNEMHDLDSISFAADAPLQWNTLNKQEISLSELGTDQCLIHSHEGASYYIRGCLEIPVVGRQQPFVWGVWCSLSEKSMREVTEHWDDPLRVQQGPYFGWLCTVIPGYPDTAFLKARVHQRAVGARPTIELEPTDHQLSLDQRHGIDADRLKDIVMTCLHGSGS